MLASDGHGTLCVCVLDSYSVLHDTPLSIRVDLHVTCLSVVGGEDALRNPGILVIPGSMKLEPTSGKWGLGDLGCLRAP